MSREILRGQWTQRTAVRFIGTIQAQQASIVTILSHGAKVCSGHQLHPTFLKLNYSCHVTSKGK